MKEEEVKKMFSKEDLLRILDEVEREPRRGRSSTRSGSVDGTPEWDDKKVSFAKNAIKKMDDSIRGVCMLNRYTSVDHKANIVFRIHLDELFVSKPPFGRFEVPDEVWEYLKKRVKRMMKKIEGEEGNDISN